MGMSVLDIAAWVSAALLLITRFFNAAKPLWGYLPRWLAVLIPSLVALIPSASALIAGSRTWDELVYQLIAGATMVIVGLFPSHQPAAKA